ncbi:MAG TPA: hypothetical protein VNB90_01945 [Cytophagaceae bacterium]|nr:hypothetical protein [Cytophagaceae bacterium]
MVENIINAYPVFESGQLLTSSQLNDTRTYLDENLRVNRTLNGIGVVSGLEVSFTGSSITITKGIGITTDGYLIPFPKDVTYTRADTYSEIDGDPTMPIYPDWFRPVDSTPFDMLELFETSGSITLSPDAIPDINTRVVVLFLKEIVDEQSTFCVSTDTDSSGSVRRYDLKVLLLTQSDFDTLTPYNNEAQVASNDPVTVIRMKRFVAASAVALNTYTDPTPITDTYTTLIEDYKVQVGTKIKSAYETYKAYFGLNFHEFTFDTFEDFVDASLNENDALVPSNLDYIQYVYAYLKDLNDACDEFSEAAYNTFKDTLPVNYYTSQPSYKEPVFSRHIALGILTDVDSGTSLTYKEKYRYYFTEQFRMDAKENEIVKTQLLFEKLVLMIRTFTIPSAGLSFPVLVTPSMKEEAPLSKRAIPYYYSLTLDGVDTRIYDIWDPEVYLRSKAGGYVYSATVQTANTSSTNPHMSVADHILAPLDYNINSNNFYRVEGHIKRSLSDVVTALTTIRQTNNIDFNVVTLELTTDSPLPIPATDNYDMSLFHHFVNVNFGMEPKEGVEAGGTFILVHSGGEVIADFSLPSQSPYNALLY